MRLIILCLTALLVLIQYPLWLGKGSWLSVRKLDGQVAQAHKKNDELRARNAKLESEVHDLQEGTGAIEEQARYELGMIRQNEIFIQVLDANGAPPPAVASLPPIAPPMVVPAVPSVSSAPKVAPAVVSKPAQAAAPAKPAVKPAIKPVVSKPAVPKPASTKPTPSKLAVPVKPTPKPAVPAKPASPKPASTPVTPTAPH